MRFQAYINEGIKVGDTNYTIEQIMEFNKFWGEVEKNCKKFLAEIRSQGNDVLIVRGMQNQRDAFIYKNIRTNRAPKDMSEEWHDAFGKVFKRKYGWNPRTEGMFCVVDLPGNGASHYGDVYYVFPDGDYKYVWSTDIPDLYSKVDDNNPIEPSSDWYSDVQSDWEHYYGEGEEGEWSWNGDTVDGSKSKEDAAEEFMERYNDGLTEEDEDERMEGATALRDIMSEMEWTPAIELEQYEEERRADWIPDESEYEESAERIIDEGDYRDKDLISALKHHKKPEISVKAKGYFGLAKGTFDDDELGMVNYDDLIHHYVFKKKYIDPKQLQLFDE